MSSSSREGLFGVTLTELVIILFFIMLLLAVFNIERITEEKEEIEEKYIEITKIEPNADGDIIIPAVSWDILVKLIWGDSEDQPINSDLVPIKQFEEKIEEITAASASLNEENERLLADNKTLNDIIDSMGGSPDETLGSNGTGECREGGFWITSKCSDHCWEINSSDRDYDYLVDIGVCKSGIVVQKSNWLEKNESDLMLVSGASEMVDRKFMQPSQLYTYLDLVMNPGYIMEPKQCFHSVNIIDLDGISAARWESIELSVADRVSRRPLTIPSSANYKEIRKRFADNICNIANATKEKPEEENTSSLGSYQSELEINNNIENKVIFAADLVMSSFSNNISRQCNNSSHLSSNRKIKNEEITLEFSIEVNERGRADSVELTSNNPNLIGSNLYLSKMAISALKRSSYIAATNNGEPISSSLTKKLRFPENFCG